MTSKERFISDASWELYMEELDIRDTCAFLPSQQKERGTTYLVEGKKNRKEVIEEAYIKLVQLVVYKHSTLETLLTLSHMVDDNADLFG